jgi:hypothetical protein
MQAVFANHREELLLECHRLRDNAAHFDVGDLWHVLDGTFPRARSGWLDADLLVVFRLLRSRRRL